MASYMRSDRGHLGPQHGDPKRLINYHEFIQLNDVYSGEDADHQRILENIGIPMSNLPASSRLDEILDEELSRRQPSIERIDTPHNPPKFLVKEPYGVSKLRDGGSFTSGDQDRDIIHRRLSASKKSTRDWLYPFALTTLSVAAFIVTMIYASPGSAYLTRRLLTASGTDSILVLRVLSEIHTLLLSASVARAFDSIQWSLASRINGITLLSFLALDSGTGILSLFRLVGTPSWRGRSHMIWSFVR
jgi:hypothetical protein